MAFARKWGKSIPDTRMPSGATERIAFFDFQVVSKSLLTAQLARTIFSERFSKWIHQPFA
jgi:hypothetical protein